MKDIKTLLLVLACAVILFLFFHYQNKITEKDNAYNQLSELTGNKQMKEEFYSFNFRLNNQMSGLIAPAVSYRNIGDDKKDKFLPDLIQKKPLLIYRFTDMNCKVCYETEIKALQEEFADVPELVTILCSYRVDQHFEEFKKMNQIKLPIYRISHNSFHWIAEDYYNPYYFVLHPGMKISNIYVPNRDFPELNKQYLEGVKRLLSE